MAEKTQRSGSGLDMIKWLVVAVLVAGGIYGNSYFAAESILYRVIGLLIVGGIACWVAIQTDKGRAFYTLCLEAKTEIRKVVWPTRQETMQTTMIVIIAVLVVAIILFGVDKLIGLAVNALIGL